MSCKKNKWTPAVVVKPKNYIVSSDAVLHGIKAFTPTFEKDCNINMHFLLSNEYMRMWFDDRKEFDNKLYIQGKSKPDVKNRRKYVPISKPKSNVRELPIITLERFQNIPSKTDHRR